METKEILCCVVAAIFSLVFLVVLLIPPLQYLKDRRAVKDKAWWRENKRFHIYYREVKKLKKNDPNVDILKAEWELKRNTVRRKGRIRLEEFFLGGGLAVIFALLDMSAYKGKLWVELFSLTSLVGLVFELCGALGFARDMHDAATPMDAERDYQNFRRRNHHTEMLAFDGGEFPPEEDINQQFEKSKGNDSPAEWIFGMCMLVPFFIVFIVIKQYLGLVIVGGFFFLSVKQLIKQRKEKSRRYGDDSKGYELEKCRCLSIENGDVYRIYTDKNDFYVESQSPLIPQVGDEIITVSFEKRRINCAYLRGKQQEMRSTAP